MMKLINIIFNNEPPSPQQDNSPKDLKQKLILYETLQRTYFDQQSKNIPLTTDQLEGLNYARKKISDIQEQISYQQENSR